MEKEPLVSDHPFVETVSLDHVSNDNMLIMPLATYISILWQLSCLVSFYSCIKLILFLFAALAVA
jgi:hypothetical protein